MKIRKNHITGFLLLAAVGLICFLTGIKFKNAYASDSIYPSQGLTETRRLSDYCPSLEGSPGDTPVYIYEGRNPGGSILILGGTHPNEPAGFITTVLLAENISVLGGRAVIIPQANISGFTHNDPQEGNPQKFSLNTPSGKRWFRFGSRLTNPVHQWPDPVLHINPAGQKLAGAESRNLNRSYPGRLRGSLTERIAYGIIQLIKTENIDLALDLHEAAPEYPVINALVFHDNSAELAAIALMELQLDGMDFRLEASPPTLRGLSHREWGDHTEAHSILMETANASHGRLKGKPSQALIVEGKDKNYVKAAELGLLFVQFDNEGIPLKRRVSRHLAAVTAIIASFNELEPDNNIIIENIPSPSIVNTSGIGAFLKPEKQP